MHEQYTVHFYLNIFNSVLLPIRQILHNEFYKKEVGFPLAFALVECDSKLPHHPFGCESAKALIFRDL